MTAWEPAAQGGRDRRADDELEALTLAIFAERGDWLAALAEASARLAAPRAHRSRARRALDARRPARSVLPAARPASSPGKVGRVAVPVRRFADAALAEATPAGPDGADGAVAIAAAAVAGAGAPLPRDLRAELERALGIDLDAVRVHTGAPVDAAARAIGARAFAIGPDLGFADGAYQPRSTDGRRLIAHEVAHTVQPAAPGASRVSSPGDACEREADAFADAFVARAATVAAPGSAASPARAPGAALRGSWTTDPGSANATDAPDIAGSRRVPLDNLATMRTGANAHPWTAERATGSGGGRAIAVVPNGRDFTRPFDVIVHFHGNNVGYRQTQAHRRMRGHDDPQPTGTVRDVSMDDIEGQVARSGRNVIALLPQGTTPMPGVRGASAFGIANLDRFVDECLGRLGIAGPPRRIIQSGHSGGGFTAIQAAHDDRTAATARLRPLLLFEAVNGAAEVRRVVDWARRSLRRDVELLGREPDLAARQRWLARHGLQLVAYYHPGGSYEQEHRDGYPETVDDRGRRHGATPSLAAAIAELFRTQQAALTRLGGGAPTILDALRAQYQVRTTGREHSTILQGNLGTAIGDLGAP